MKNTTIGEEIKTSPETNRNLEETLAFNREFVEKKEYLKYNTDKKPDKKMVVVTCMDTRLTELLPQAMNIKNGDAKIIKNAGGTIVHPFGSVMRSILIAIYELGVEEVYIIPHYDCGTCNLDTFKTMKNMIDRGINKKTIKNLFHSGIDVDKWLHGFEDVEESLRKSVDICKNHPLMPEGIPVHGLVIDPETGRLDLIIDGWKELEDR